ncbi:hypothetical protein [Nocardia aurantia]|nr:hypothetical protein [Nocardia aurantia]
MQLLAVYNKANEWQRARQTPAGLVRKNPPKLVKYLDLPAIVLVGILRIALGAGVSALFAATQQISGPSVAVTLGCTAPAFLEQLGRARPISKAVSRRRGTTGADPAPAQPILPIQAIPAPVDPALMPQPVVVDEH